jgi:hypothetical protein
MFTYTRPFGRYQIQSMALRESVGKATLPVGWKTIASRPTERWARRTWWKWVNMPVAHSSYNKLYRIFDIKTNKVVEP